MASAAMSPGIAVAQNRDRGASPEELWRDYPLTQENDASRAPPRTETSGGPPAERTREEPGDDGVGPAVIVLAALLVAALVAPLVLLMRRGRRRRGTPPGVAPKPAASHRPQPGPPAWDALRTSAWTAQISWRRDEGAARFCVMAAPPGGEEATLMESASIPWPPQSEAEVQALIDEVGKLERAVVAAGWEATEPGRSWFARRFVWTRADRAPELAIGRARIAGRA
jgi:hypothetical protein